MKRAFLWAVAGLLLLCMLGAGALVIWRANLQREVASDRRFDAAGGIDITRVVQIGGIPQVVRIRGRSLDNPVLLFLHGGPGTPMIPFAHAFQNDWEGHFTVVQWDQRGTGLTAGLSDPQAVARQMSIEQMSADVIELTNYLRREFDKPKIFLLGHSWGSILGLPIAKANPDLYYAFIGIGQVIDVRRNEALGYARDLLLAEKIGHEEAIAELKSIAPYPPAGAWRGEGLEIRHKWNAYFGESVFGYQSMAKAMAHIAWSSPDYSLMDFWRLMNQPDAPYANLETYIHNYDVRRFGKSWDIPVFFIMGRYDYQVNPELMSEYFYWIEAPQKKLYFITKAAHAPMVEQPATLTNILVGDVRRVAP